MLQMMKQPKIEQSGAPWVQAGDMHVAVSIVPCDTHMKARPAVSICSLVVVLVNSLFIHILPLAAAFPKASFDVLPGG